jgi:exopolyphosphatase/pppGpp-phosphohydrolase
MPKPNAVPRKPPVVPATLAVVDLGSNSFRLEVGRVEGDQIFRLDTWRETIRIGAGMDENGRLTTVARRAALACLTRFREHLPGRDKRRDVPAAGGGSAGIPDRRHRRP